MESKFAFAYCVDTLPNSDGGWNLTTSLLNRKIAVGRELAPAEHEDESSTVD